MFANPLAPLDLRLKISETIVITLKSLGKASIKYFSCFLVFFPFISSYADILLNTYLQMMTKDNQLTWREVARQKGKEVTAEDEIFAIQALRASCFSSLAEVISHIKYRMGPYIPVRIYPSLTAIQFVL